MRAGKLRHRLIVLAPSETLDAYKDPTLSFVPVAEVQGEVEPLSGVELFYARQVKSEITHKITLRYLSLLTAKHRLQYQQSPTAAIQTFLIEQPFKVDFQNHEMTINAYEQSL